MLIVQIGCLCFTLFVLQKYVKWKINLEAHRLLPLILVLVVVYDFYETVAMISGEKELFLKLEDLLLAQMLYLLFCYLKEFCKMRIPDIISSILFVMLLIENISVFVLFDDWLKYRGIFLGILVLYSVLYIYIGAYSFFVYSMSKREYFVDGLLFTALVIPCITIHWIWLEAEWAKLLLSASLCISCGIILYLMWSGKLEDTTTVIKKDIYDTSDAGTILFDADMYYLDSNQRAKEFFEELSGMEDKIGRRDRNQNLAYKDKITYILQSDKKYNIVEWKGCFYQCSIIPVVYKGKTKGYVVNIFDVTYQSEKMNRMEALAAMKSRFLAVISHDLRTPIHAIIGIADIILSGKRVSAKNRSLLIQQKNAGNMLLDQVNSILVFSKMEAGRLELADNEYNFENMLLELANVCVVNLASKPIGFRLSFNSVYPVKVSGDEKRVYEMIQNLLSNAMKFTEKGKISCDVECETEGDRVLFRVSVSDTGTGMSREQIESAFSEYVSFAENSSKEGFGLGLSIVRQLSGMMGGSVSAESDGKSGTTVNLCFYQKVCESESRQPVSFTKEKLMNRTFSCNFARKTEYIYPDSRILVVDDMKTNLDIFRGFVEPLKINVDTAFGGYEAVELVRKNDYQLIFLDKMMPGIGGIETADIINTLCDSPVFLVTADTTVDMAGIASEHDITGVLHKPVNVSELDRLIYSHMPEKYRVKNNVQNDFMFSESNKENEKVYFRTLKTYLSELKDIEMNIVNWAENDIEMFRTKVHGIKGVSKQLGRLEIGESAEILEMAAKTENYSYISEHMDDFLAEVRENIQRIETETVECTFHEAGAIHADTINMEDITDNKAEVWNRLKKGFENYDINLIEKEIEALKKLEPDEMEKALLNDLIKASEEFEYEEGVQLIVKSQLNSTISTVN